MSKNETSAATPSMEDPGYKEELLERAKLMGLTIHPNAKVETIAAKIAAKLKDEPDPEADEDEAEAPKAKTAKAAAPNKDIHPARKLHRVNITCNDPQKADQTGDIIQVSNGEVGTIRFYFHFGKPWHVPEIVLETLKESKLFLHSSRKDGREVVAREVPRYNIQYLNPLDEKQRERIATKQAAVLVTED